MIKVGDLLILRKNLDAIGMALMRINAAEPLTQPLLVLSVGDIKTGFNTPVRVLAGKRIEIVTLIFLEKMYEVVS